MSLPKLRSVPGRLTRRSGLVLSLMLFVLAGGAALLADWPYAGPHWQLVGWNNLGMHCMDSDYSVFSILPPFNTVNAQLMDTNGRLVTNAAALGITVTYESVADPSGSANRSSRGKSTFWKYAPDLFGVALPEDQGLAGFPMPGSNNTPRAAAFVNNMAWFEATGIPITPVDDTGRYNAYPMMRLVARNSGGTVLASTDVVLPVSSEMDCRACHGSDASPAAQPPGGWVNDPDADRDYHLNILKLHDASQSGNPLYQTALAAVGYPAAGLHASAKAGHPILCAACHASEALGTGGVAGVPPLTRAVHSKHASVINPDNGLVMDASNNRTSCYQCHPGSATKCLRGAMGAAVAQDGSMSMQCQSCHGGMSTVGSTNRTGWLDEPNCQACHTGTATHNNGQIRYASVFVTNAVMRVPVDTTFATTPNTPDAGISLYRFSKGHGGLQCSACHGSTHAEFPSFHGNDNIQSQKLQGHGGVLMECASCHNPVPVTGNGGPHGMHPVGIAWVKGHGTYGEGSRAQACQACHGTDYRGTVLSRVQGDRVFNTDFGTKRFADGTTVSCYACHNGPANFNRNTNTPPVAGTVVASTPAGFSVPLALPASDVNANPLSLRIISQPQHGTVGLTNTTARFFPDAGFLGTDTFTYAVWDGAIDSTLGTGTVYVTGRPIDGWRSLKFTTNELANTTVSGPYADPDGDGLPNFMEYAFALKPKTQDRSKLPAPFVTGSGASRAIAFQVRRPSPMPSDLFYQYQFSSNLTSWVTNSWIPVSGTVTNLDGTESQQLRAPVTGLPREYGRIRVQFSP